MALYVSPGLRPAARPDAVSDGRAWRAWAPALAAAPILVALGAWLGAQWAGYRASREAVFPDPFPPHVAYVRQEGDREMVLYRTDRGLGIAELERGRFGWRRLWSIDRTPGSSWVPGRPAAPATIHWERPYPSHGQFLVWGELHDTRVAFLEVAGERFAMGQGSPLFLIQVAEAPEYGPGGLQNLRLLDASGRAVLPEEVEP